MKIKIAAIQFDVLEGQIDANMQRAEALMNDAAKAGAEFLILPEMWPTAWDYPRMSEYAQAINGEIVTFLRKFAKDNSVFLVGGSFAENKQGKIYNTCPIIDQTGNLIAKYRKVHLFSYYLQEHLYFAAGEDWVLSKYHKGGEQLELGHLICYDLRFPEFARNLALRGARLFSVPSGWPAARISEFETLCRARAIENRSFLACTNHTDTHKGVYCGNSMIITPFGEIAAKLGNEEGYAEAEIDLAILDEPATFNSIADRRQFLDEIDDNQL